MAHLEIHLTATQDHDRTRIEVTDRCGVERGPDRKTVRCELSRPPALGGAPFENPRPPPGVRR
ncbi:hypothetical protein ACFV23_14115 [Streptomyces sp. NPDC059627]